MMIEIKFDSFKCEDKKEPDQVKKVITRKGKKWIKISKQKYRPK